MDVSVIVPTRNRLTLLKGSLRSVLEQQGVQLEAIVVDEGSTDETARWLATVADPRVRVIRHERPLGVSAARNRGAAAATGDWLAFLDDDDLWAPDKLMSQLRAANGADRDWAYTGSVNITHRGDVAYGRPPLPADQMVAALPHYNAMPGGGSNVAVRRRTWLRAGPFDVRLRNTEDWDMSIRLAKLSLPACVCRPLIGYRVHDANASLDIAEIVRGTKLIEELHHTTADWGRLHRWMAESCLRRGQRTAAVGQFVRAAVRGQARGVVSDVFDVLRRRVGRPGGAANRDRPSDEWVAAAAAWLRSVEDDRATDSTQGRSAVSVSGGTIHG